MNTKLLVFSSLAVLFMSCDNKSTETATTDSLSVDTIAVLPVVEVTQLWTTDSVMKSSESVLYDKARNIVYVSCINGKPTDLDKNGYISKLKLDGTIETLEWIKGLDAPKGLGMYKNKLYVTDLTKLVEIDIEKGKITKSYPVAGAVFLNDITVDTAGVVYFTDSETNKIHTLKNGKVSTWLDNGLNKPNGLLIEANRLLLASYGSNDFKAIDLVTKEITMIATEVGAGDGIAYFGKAGHYIVSEWNGTVYLVEPDGSKNLVIDTKGAKINSADIEFVQESSMLLVPTFFDNKVVAYKITHNE